MTYEEVARRIESATSAVVFFGPDATVAKAFYRHLSLAVHPDKVDPMRRVQAEELFARLSALWASYTGTDTLTGHVTVATRKRSYAVEREGLTGAVANLYRCTWMQDGAPRAGWMKMPRLPRDSDLMQTEAEVLKAFAASGDKAKVLVPEFIESFRHRDKATKVERRVNVTEQFPGMVSLTEVMAAFPDGLDHRDAAWMFRRLLMALWLAHECGYVHGAVLPCNIWIQPEHHGLELSEWCFSVPLKQPLSAWDSRHRDFYPSEVEKKEAATPATDLYMAAKTLGALVGKNAPAPLRSFIRGCTLDWEAMRPHNAWELRREYDELIEMLYGPRRFRPFKMPEPN